MSTTYKGIHMTEEDIEALIARKEEALAKQQARKEKLERTMENTCNDLEQLRFTLFQLRRVRKKKRPRTLVRRSEVAAFFIHLSAFFRPHAASPAPYAQQHLVLPSRQRPLCLRELHAMRLPPPTDAAHGDGVF